MRLYLAEAAESDSFLNHVDSPWKALVVIAMFMMLAFIAWCALR